MAKIASGNLKTIQDLVQRDEVGLLGSTRSANDTSQECRQCISMGEKQMESSWSPGKKPPTTTAVDGNFPINPFEDEENLPFSLYPFYNDNQSIFFKSNQFYAKSRRIKEITDVCEIKNTLYRLLADFHQEKLHAFGDGITFENMIKVREQQENLARLHFELNLQQTAKQSIENDFFNDAISSNSILNKSFSKSNMIKLIHNLQNLCKSIERLQIKNSKESAEFY